MFEAGQGVNYAPGGVVSVLTIKPLREYFLLLFMLQQELSEAAIPQFAHGLQWLCNAFAAHCAVRSLPSLLLKQRVTALQDPGSVITCSLFISLCKETGYRHKRVTLQWITSYQFYISFSIQN